MSLVGKFFFHFGKEYSQSGKVVEQIDAATVLVEFEGCEHVPGRMIALPAAGMVAKEKPDGTFDSDWEFFHTKEQLDEWLEWLDAPSESVEAEKKAATIN